MNISTKHVIFILMSILLIAATASAESMYVSGEFKTMLRTGPGTSRKILSMLPAGQSVEVIGEEAEWSEIRLPNGKEGWIPTLYLSRETPITIKYQRLEAKYNELVQKNETLDEKLSETSSSSSELGKTLRETQAELKKVKSNYENLKRESADFIKFKATFEQNQKELKETRTKSEQFESELNRLASSQLIEGFLYGGGLVIIGFIAGFALKKPKRRSGLL